MMWQVTWMVNEGIDRSASVPLGLPDFEQSAPSMACSSKQLQ